MKVQLSQNNSYDHGKLTNTFSGEGGKTNMGNNKLALTKDFKAGIPDTKEQNDFQVFISQFNLDTDAHVKE